MSIEEARKAYIEAKKAVEDCQGAIAGLQTKRDTLEASLPELTPQMEHAERRKQTALDNYVLRDDKQSESELRKARLAYKQAGKRRDETNELCEVVHRALKKRESELPKLHTQADLQKRECWESIAGEIRSRISEGIVSDIQRLIVVGTQTGKTKQFILSELLPNLNPSEYQAMRDELIGKYNIE